MMRPHLGAALLLAVLASGCGTSSPPVAGPRPGLAPASGTQADPSPAAGPLTASIPLRLAAASDLQSVLPVLGKQFTSQTGIELSLTFGASGQLAEQIKAGAPFDVFLAANRKFVEDLAADGLVRADSVKSYARGSLVLAVHRESVKSVAGLADLKRPEIKKIALANPETAPYGKAGKQALERAGLWDALAPKVVRSESVRQALVFVKEGNAEAGMVGRAIADVPGVRIVEVDPALYDPIIQGLGIVAATKQAEPAGKFAAFVLSDEGQSILANFGSRSPVRRPARRRGGTIGLPAGPPPRRAGEST